jgi:methionyl-tRNA formyltransferase
LPLMRTDSIAALDLPEADLMVVIAFGQKIPPEIVNHPRLGSVNLHASRLPEFRGAAPINWAIIAGKRTTGNSIIRLAQKMDAGAILGQSTVEIGETETAGELHDRLAVDGAALLLRVVSQLASGTETATAQIEGHATQAPKLDRAAATLDFDDTADHLARRIRGLYPVPGCRVALQDAAGRELTRLTLIRARPIWGEGDRWRPGEIDLNGYISVANGAEALEILEVQPAGKKPMSLTDYRRGNLWAPGIQLAAIKAD